MIIYDVEILRAIPDRRGERQPDIEYCAGFDDFHNMGIACLCGYNYADDSYFVFGKNELGEFEKLVKQTDCVVGYNIFKFDNNLLNAEGVNIPRDLCYDLFHEIYLKTKRFIGLNAMSEANGGKQKTENGALAPIMWQKGEYTRVINYCLNDVRMTKRLVDKVIRQGWLYCPSKEIIRLRKP
jgi:hypothetical protein